MTLNAAHGFIFTRNLTMRIIIITIIINFSSAVVHVFLVLPHSNFASRIIIVFGHVQSSSRFPLWLDKWYRALRVNLFKLGKA